MLIAGKFDCLLSVDCKWNSNLANCESRPYKEFEQSFVDQVCNIIAGRLCMVLILFKTSI